jgi:hypothetical protein
LPSIPAEELEKQLSSSLENERRNR